MYYIYVDEAGRGPIAGPVYVGIIIQQFEKEIEFTGKNLSSLPGVKSKKYSSYCDSKIITEEKRELMYEKLTTDKTIVFSSGSSESTEVDSKGIVRSIRNAIAKALWNYFCKEKNNEEIKEEYTAKTFRNRMKNHRKEIVIIMDGNTDFHMRKLWGIKVRTVIDGDAKVQPICAASIIAKVERDRMMRQLHMQFPEYGFDSHKGYGTKKHYAAIELHGMSGLHRKSFLKNMKKQIEEIGEVV